MRYSSSNFAEPTVKLSSSLEALADYYSLTREGDAHRALSDVLLLSKVFQKLTIDLKLSLSDLVLRCHTASDISAAMAKNKKA
jgi:DNA polymerase III epsilon subunit-like protein